MKMKEKYKLFQKCDFIKPFPVGSFCPHLEKNPFDDLVRGRIVLQICIIIYSGFANTQSIG